ncbi:Sulfotransferase family protein [Algoriphagus locisalis]|uniref:Sulfotransferase family protein n=1 Tax=Algoriphagus locisalis TaxID=305507 RepID=A0A1I6XQK9_9BACT|nr:sulfotransferase [Algoriphagus locisalis]SFT40695.1 Sulfotransferase family protein [Algoriphagus locisalis]
MEKIKKLDFIFVGGMPRSGTTLVGQLTSQSDDVWVIPTDNSIINYLPKLTSVDFDLTGVDLVEIIQRLLLNTTASKWGLSVDEVITASQEFEIKNWYDLSICFLLAAKSKYKQTIYLKSPGLEYYFFTIEQRLPIKYIRKYTYVVRNPIESYLSMKYAGLAWRNKLEKVVDDSINWSFRWRQSVNMYLLNKALLGDNMFLIKYEDNVKNRKQVFLNYFPFLGLELTEKVLNHKNKRQSSINGHGEIERVLTQLEISNISTYCFDYMKLFDYLSADEKSNFYTDFRLTEINLMENTEIIKVLSKKILKGFL